MSSLTFLPEDLAPGSVYEFTFVQQSGNGQWYEWTMAAQFLERQNHRTGDVVDKLILSGRPEFGTTDIPVAHIRHIRPDNKPTRPVRRAGAVPPPSGR